MDVSKAVKGCRIFQQRGTRWGNGPSPCLQRLEVRAVYQQHSQSTGFPSFIPKVSSSWSIMASTAFGCFHIELCSETDYTCRFLWYKMYRSLCRWLLYSKTLWVWTLHSRNKKHSIDKTISCLFKTAGVLIPHWLVFLATHRVTGGLAESFGSCRNTEPPAVTPRPANSEPIW